MFGTSFCKEVWHHPSGNMITWQNHIVYTRKEDLLSLDIQTQFDKPVAWTNYNNDLVETCWLGNVKLISCLVLHGKKSNEVDVQKGIFFLFYQTAMEMLFWTHSCGQKGPMNQGPSFRLYVLLSGSFLEIGSLVFSENQHGVRGPCLVVVDRAGFFLKKSFCPENWEMGKNWAKNRVFWIYWEIWSSIFSEFGLWRNFMMFPVFLHKSHTWEKSGSWDMSQNALNQSDCTIFKLTIS